MAIVRAGDGVTTAVPAPLGDQGAHGQAGQGRWSWAGCLRLRDSRAQPGIKVASRCSLTGGAGPCPHVEGCLEAVVVLFTGTRSPGCWMFRTHQWNSRETRQPWGGNSGVATGSLHSVPL